MDSTEILDMTDAECFVPLPLTGWELAVGNPETKPNNINPNNPTLFFFQSYS